MVDLSWTIEDVMADNDRVLAARDYEPICLPSDPIFQWDALKRIQSEQKRFEKGDSLALFQSLSLCARHSLVMPEWTAVAISKGFYRVATLECTTWDEAFGTPYRPAGVQRFRVSDARKRRNLEIPVAKAMFEKIKAGASVVRGTYEDVADELHIGSGQVREIWEGNSAPVRYYRQLAVKHQKRPRKSTE